MIRSKLRTLLLVTFLIIPPTVIQMPDYSDIEGKHTDYIWHLTDINKTEFLKKQQERIEKLKLK